MMYDTDKLGRGPIFRPRVEPEIIVGDDWRGEHHLKIPARYTTKGESDMTRPEDTRHRDAERRKVQIAQMHSEGMTHQAMADELGVGQATVGRDLKVLGLAK